MDIRAIPCVIVEFYGSHYAEEAGVPEHPPSQELIDKVIISRINKISEDKISEIQKYIIHDPTEYKEYLKDAYTKIVSSDNPLVKLFKTDDKAYLVSIINEELKNEHYYLTLILYESEIMNKPIILPEIVNVLKNPL